MGRNYCTLSFETARCIGIVRTMTTLTHLICLSLCDEMFRSCEDNTYIIIIVIYRSYLWSWTMPFIASRMSLYYDDFDHRVRTTLSLCEFALHCGLAITVVERLQRYNCIWVTYIDNVEQNILFYIEVWSCEVLSLCGKLIWKWNAVFWLGFVFRRRLYRYLVWITSFLRSWRTTLVSWLFTFGWEPVCFENFSEVFRSFWIQLVKSEFVDL